MKLVARANETSCVLQVTQERWEALKREETFCINFSPFKNMDAADTAIPHSMPPFGKQEWGIGYREEAGLLHHYLLAALDVDALGQADAVGHPHALQVVDRLVGLRLAAYLYALNAAGVVLEGNE